MDTKKKNIIVCIITVIFFGAGLILFIVKPETDYSISERRKLQKKPDISVESVENGRFMTTFEKYSMDQFPFRESLRTLKSKVVTDIFNMKDKGGLYEYKGFISDMDYPLNSDSVKYAVDRFNYIKEEYLTDDNKTYISLIPDKNIYIGNISGHLTYDFSDMEEIVKQKMPYASYIDIEKLLSIEDFYMTDTHFKQECIIPIASEIAKSMGRNIDKDYKEIKSHKDFFGVYYGQYSKHLKPDTITYLTNDTIEEMIVYDGENNKEIPVYDLKRLNGKDPYEMFLSGPLSLITINNPNADNSKRLIMFRDSFGSSIAPIIATGYKETVLIDIRYISPKILDRFVDFKNADVLFLYSSLVLNNSGTIK